MDSKFQHWTFDTAEPSTVRLQFWCGALDIKCARPIPDSARGIAPDANGARPILNIKLWFARI